MTFSNAMRFDDTPNLDAFSRLRVSQPLTLFDSKQIHDNQPLFWDDQQESGSGTTSVHSVNAARTRMGVALNTAGKRTRQTFMRFTYHPGKSQLVVMTTLLSGGGSGITASVGAFDDDNGIFFSSIDGTLKAVIRSNVTGTPVDTAISQSSWNKDKMDGSGPSGQTIDPTKTQILWFDFEWLGVGRIRFGFKIDGIFILAHQVLNANALDVVYMSTPNLPLRYQIENDGTGAATTMDHLCSTVISEGGKSELGVLRCVSTGGTHVDVATENIIYAILGIRLKSTHLGADIEIVSADIAEHTGSKFLEWMLILNGTVAGPPTWGDETNSAIQTFTGATANTVTGGTVIGGGHFASANKGGAEGNTISSALRLGAAIDNTVDEIVLAVRPIGGSANADVEGSLIWREEP